jgi:hypothetical protein
MWQTSKRSLLSAAASLRCFLLYYAMFNRESWVCCFSRSLQDKAKGKQVSLLSRLRCFFFDSLLFLCRIVTGTSESCIMTIIAASVKSMVVTGGIAMPACRNWTTSLAHYSFYLSNIGYQERWLRRILTVWRNRHAPVRKQYFTECWRRAGR